MVQDTGTALVGSTGSQKLTLSEGPLKDGQVRVDIHVQHVQELTSVVSNIDKEDGTSLCQHVCVKEHKLDQIIELYIYTYDVFLNISSTRLRANVAESSYPRLDFVHVDEHPTTLETLKRMLG